MDKTYLHPWQAAYQPFYEAGARAGRKDVPREWKACGYVRLSREDGDKEESNSVTGQKELIRAYLREHAELRECAMRVDDGYTGSNFQRPAFQEMMENVRAGTVNCIVVKDLSRFGRDYLEAGEYIERIFPFLGVRFIAINDHYDSLHRNAESDDLIIPFKNLINEAYCRDISVKVRSQLEVKRRRGDFIGSFPVFGYRKDPDDRHRLLVDAYAADVVRDIFHWKLDGYSSADIAGRLTELGIPTPLDYKQQQGARYSTPFRVKSVSSWDAKTVLRILQNPVYIGTLEQGRVTTPSFKVKRPVRRPREEWAIVENAHEPVIDRDDFETVQKVLAMDTRTARAGEAVEPFAGLVYCGECGSPMVRKTVPSGKKKYVYYVCAAHKADGSCHAHSLRDTALEEIVLELVRQQLSAVTGPDALAALADTATLRQHSMRKLAERLARKREEIERAQFLLDSLYENLAEGLIDRDECRELREAFESRKQAAEAQAEAMRRQYGEEAARLQGSGWIEQLRRQKNLAALDRRAAVTLLEHILVYRGQRVGVVFRWQDPFSLFAEGGALA